MSEQPIVTLRLAVSCVVQDGDKFLLVERAYEPAKGQFAFAGGKVEPYESLEDAARRELLEETGIMAGEVTLLRQLAVEGGFHLHVFFAHRFTGVPIAGDDAASVGWFTIAQMKDMPMPQSVYEVATELVQGSILVRGLVI
jgi:8-oxo-dGTP diphosphatase